jgi:hypothetical protein
MLHSFGTTSREIPVLRARSIYCTERVPELSESSVHRAGGRIPHIGEYVRVDVEGEANVRVAQKFLDVFRVDPLPE